MPVVNTDLVFAQLPASGSPVDLVFGGDAVGPVDDVFAELLGALPQLTATVSVATVDRGLLSGAFAPPTMVITGAYHSNVQRPTVGKTATNWQGATGLDVGRQLKHDDTAALPAGATSGWQSATPWQAGAATRYADAARGMGGMVAGAFGDGVSARSGATGLFDNAVPSCRRQLQGMFQNGRRNQRTARARYQNATRTRNGGHWPWQVATGQEIGRSAPFGTGCDMRRGVSARGQEGITPPPGISPVPVIPIVPPPYWGTALLFACPPLAAPHLVFGTTQCTPGLPGGALLYILPARFYMTAHTIQAHRLPDLAEVPIFEASVSADAGSYCWTLSASGPSSLFEQLAPQAGLPVQLRITLDGIPFVFAVDALSRSGSFGKTGVSISGRSVTALIGAPYLRATTRNNAGGSRLAQQLATDALEFTGIDLDWGLTDWLVPAGAWGHTGTPLDAVQEIVHAAGGYLQSHRSLPTLLTRHPYSQRAGDNPGAPWGWMTGPADVELAPDAIITEGLERKDGADINAVYVSGTAQGVLALVKRTGTAADKLAAMVADPLMTHVDAARQRGLSVLGAAGNKYHVRLELPVLTGLGQPGVLEVGQLVQVNAAQPWRGRVRAVGVTAKRPSLRQTITLERHLEIA